MTVRMIHLSLLATVLLLAGCGDAGNTIHGKITVNGVPLDEGEIQFVSVKSVGGDQIGTVVTKGEYRLTDSERLEAGEYQVQIRAYRGSGKKIWDGMGDGKNKNMVEDLKQYIPAKYNDASELKLSVKPGDNPFSTDLQIPAK